MELKAPASNSGTFLHFFSSKSMSQKTAVAIISIALLFAIFRFNHIPVGSFFDDAHYIVLAKSLFSGQGYRLINFPHAPIETAFPPGWPILLGLYLRVVPFTLFTVKIPAFLFWIGANILAVQLFVPRLPYKYASAFIALLLLNPNLIGISGTAMSEPAYLFFSLLTIFIFKKWQAERKAIWLLIFATVLLILTITIRSIGISLFFAIGLLLLVQLRHLKPRYWLLIAVLLAGLTVPFFIFNQSNGGFLFFSSLYSTHITYISANFGSFLRFWESGAYLSPTLLAHSIIPIFNIGLFSSILGVMTVKMLSLVVLALTAWGIIISFKEPQVEDLYFVFYIGIFYVWAVYIQEVQPRIAIPIIPFMLFYFSRAVVAISAKIKGIRTIEKNRLASITLWGAVSCAILFNIYTLQNPFHNRVIDLSIGSTWLRDHSAENAIVMSTNPVPDYLYLNRQTVKYNRSESLTSQLSVKDVDYILIHPPLEIQGESKVLDSFTRTQVLEFVQTDSAKFELVFSDEAAQVWIYKIL